MIRTKIPSGCKTVDELLYGGFPTSRVCGISAPTTGGKTFLGLHFCLQANKMGSPAVIVETEGMDYDYGAEFLGKRFGVKPDLYTEEGRDIKDILALFGLNLRKMDVSKGGRLVTTVEVTDDFKIAKMLEETKPKVLLLDSFSQFFKNYIEQKSENLPTRATIEEMLFGRLQVLAEKFDIAVIVTHQAAGINPIFPNAFRDPYSSDVVFYNTKYLLEIMTPTAEQEKTYKGRGEPRRVRRARYELRKPSEWEIVLIKEDVGFTEL